MVDYLSDTPEARFGTLGARRVIPAGVPGFIEAGGDHDPFSISFWHDETVSSGHRVERIPFLGWCWSRDGAINFHIVFLSVIVAFHTMKFFYVNVGFVDIVDVWQPLLGCGRVSRAYMCVCAPAPAYGYKPTISTKPTE